jgi:hypothetical protein
MEYEYTSILVEGKYAGEILTTESLKELNAFYSVGWEFVNAISQTVSTGKNTVFAPIVITLRRKK